MSEYLKPCPFCGNEAILEERVMIGESDNFHRWFYECQTCGVENGGFVTGAEATTAWNTRINPLDIPPKFPNIDALYEE